MKMPKLKWDRRFLFLILIVVIAVPLLNPIGLPLIITESVRDSYDEIEALPPGSIVYIDHCLGPSEWPEWGVTTIAILRQLLRRQDLKVVLISTGKPEGSIIFEQMVRPLPGIGDKLGVYGEDWVDLGYVMGGEVALAAMATDFYEAVPKDVHGTPTTELQIFDDIATAADFDMAILARFHAMYIRQWYINFEIPMIAMCYGLSAPDLMPYLNAGQLRGMVPGLTGAAQYELLINVPGEASSQADAISLSHMLLVVVVIIGNIQYLVKGLKPRGAN